ncbi:DNA/RNA polymerase, partial [Rhodotorula sp. JG-1b]
MSASDASRARTRSPRVKSRSPSATAWTLGRAAKTTATTAHHHESVPIRESKRFEVPSETLMKRMGGPSDGKAGLSGGFRTEEEINQILYEGSKGSKFLEDQKRRDKDTQAKVDKLRGILAKKLLEARGNEEACADAILAQLEETRDLSRVITLVDADAFYAACHQLEDPSLAGTAFGVGGGMLTTASYEARRYGCRSAMPLFLAKLLCPHIKSLSLKPELYTRASKAIFSILEKYGPIAPASLDEAYADMTDYCANEGVTPAEAVARMRAEVYETTGLTVSAGVSPNKTLSKIAADINKPNGQFVIDPTAEACQAFIRDKPLRKCYGIGRVTEMLLNGLGLKTVGDIYKHRCRLYLMRDHLPFRWLLSLYLGLGSNSVKRAKRGDRKSYGAEKTFHPTSDRTELDNMIKRIAKSLAKDVARSEFSGRTITLSIKHDNFQRVTRAHTPGRNIWIHSYQDMVKYGLELL